MLTVELPELPEIVDDDIAPVYRLTDGLVDSEGSFCQGSSIFILQIVLDILCGKKTVNFTILIIHI